MKLPVLVLLNLAVVPPLAETTCSFCAGALVPTPKLVPSKVSAEPLVRALVDDAYSTPLAVNEVKPVPPLAVANVPPIVIVPDVVTGPPDVVKPVVPPDTATLVTVPELPAVAAIV